MTFRSVGKENVSSVPVEYRSVTLLSRFSRRKKHSPEKQKALRMSAAWLFYRCRRLCRSARTENVSDLSAVHLVNDEDLVVVILPPLPPNQSAK